MSKVSEKKLSELSSQIETQQRRVDFDNFDISVKELTSMAVDETIDVAPEYQRQFRWKTDNRSRFIESVFLGIPIPNIFAAANKDGTWELIDGVQRLSTLMHFVGDERMWQLIGEAKPLKLQGLEILTELNGLTFQDLPKSLSLKFLLRPVKVTTLTDKSDRKVRFDLFERLNTGGVVLTQQEIRACVYRGPFYSFIKELSENNNFLNVLRLPSNRMRDGTPEELVLKFFAYYYNRESFKHSVTDFLNDFLEDSIDRFDYQRNREMFEKVFSELDSELPNGMVRGERNNTPLILFEAVTVGAAVALSRGCSITGKNVTQWINSAECLRHTSGGGMNTRKKLLERIEYCAREFCT